MAKKEFSGVWMNTYTYHSNKRNIDAESKNLMRAHQREGRLIFETISDMNDAYLSVRLHIDDAINGRVATGSWYEQTADEGYYHGDSRHGVLQLFISDDKKTLSGKWLGYDSLQNIQSNEWKLEYLGEDVPADMQPTLADKPSA
jgi:hypothetical protein